MVVSLTLCFYCLRCFVRWLLADYIKVSNIGSTDSNNLYTEADLEASMDKIEVINFHEQKEVNGKNARIMLFLFFLSKKNDYINQRSKIRRKHSFFQVFSPVNNMVNDLQFAAEQSHLCPQ